MDIDTSSAISPFSLYSPAFENFRVPDSKPAGPFIVGVGSPRWTPLEILGQGIMQCLDTLAIDMAEVRLVASVQMKQFDPAYREFSNVHGVSFATCDMEQMSSVVYGPESPVKRMLAPASISICSALYFAGARKLLAAPFVFRWRDEQQMVVVSVCKDICGR